MSKSLSSSSSPPFAKLPADLSSVIVVIPALNEEASLPLVLNDLPEVGQVIVVDNGSSDATAKIASECGATVISEPNRGYGAACLAGLNEIVSGRVKTGHLWALQNRPGF